ncbi:MAG: AAA family ATPase [Patescibacteria group bacterium]|jgi:dephospho-CoA kinase
MIIGLVGPLAAGKGTITTYLTEKHGARSVKFSKPLRDIIHRVYKQETREYMSSLAQFLRAQFGNDILVRTLIQDIEHMDVSIAVFDGLRYFDEYNALKERSDFRLWAIDADMEIRHKRILQRGENADDTTVTFEEFKKQHELATEINIPEIMKKADAHINNNGSLADLYSQVDKLIQEFGK